MTKRPKKLFRCRAQFVFTVEFTAYSEVGLAHAVRMYKQDKEPGFDCSGVNIDHGWYSWKQKGMPKEHKRLPMNGDRHGS